jgi:outer membrane protein assembly factor BamB
MNFFKNKQRNIKAILIVGFLVMINISTFGAVYATDIQTNAYIGVSPNPVQVNQELRVTLWITPSINSYQVYHDLIVEFQKPDGTIDTVGPFDTDVVGTGSFQFDYVPDQTGTWQIKIIYPGGDIIDGNTYLSTTSPTQEFVVQTDPTPQWIYTELPSNYTHWGRPINSENRKWNVYAGDWPQQGYNASMTNFNPYSTAPVAPHILWTRQTGVTGLIGGKYNGTSYSQASKGVNIILAGLVFYSALDGVHCIDVHTGEELWVKQGINPTMGVAAPQHNLEDGESRVAELWEIGQDFVKYDPFTGIETLRVQNVLPGIYAEPYFYSYSNGRLITWKTDNRIIESNASLGEISSFSDLIVSNVSCSYDFNLIWGNIGVTINKWPNESAAINLTTGESIWNKVLSLEENPVGNSSIADGKIFVPGEGMVFRAYSIFDGEKIWTSEQAEYPWGSIWANSSAVAYGNLYVLSADGHVYCFDTETGQINWSFYSGDSFGETPYDTWAFSSNPVVADGKIYVSTMDPTPVEPKPIGNRLFCLNATSGEEIWKIDFAGGLKAVGEGSLLATNEYNGILYCFGRARTSVEVLVSPTIATQGSPILIEGYVLDQSPEIRGEPVVGNKDMARWMEYLYMQRPCPTEIVGVSVQIRVIQDSTGSKQDLGFAETDLYGHFSFEFTPPVPGLYTVATRFLGTDPYFSSWKAIGLSVQAPSPPINFPETITPADNTLLFLILIGITSIAIVIGLYNLVMIKNQKKSKE